MKKETIIAIFLGVLAGIGVAVVMVEKAREHQMTNAQSISTSIQLSPTVSVKNTQFQPLEVSEPENGGISSVKLVTIKGKASAGALVIVQSAVKNVVQKLENENFEVKAFPLSLGENTIRISVYPGDIQIPIQEKELKIYYLDEQ